ncbi:hypothetical protein GPX89_12960 [Nocardia sp. ET3-3]|uniref:Uncharacterized protein n=1 Tax=Nocardia terrae TaxID=2675851 RepID=A0A7K1UV47_9NOCA|nr:hypothetical protein [Nocardia terrae]MVU78151.1 hypothetical protein [Nocardia terrae]
MNGMMTRPPHWLDRHEHGHRGWPAGWVVDRYTVQLPVVEMASAGGGSTEAAAPRPECDEARRDSGIDEVRGDSDSTGLTR